MATGPSNPADFLPDLAVGGFGLTPPSLLVPYFSWNRILPPAFASITSDPVLPGNVNRWAVILSSHNSSVISMSTRQPLADFQGMFVVQNQQNQIITFADVGTVITLPLWLWWAGSNDVEATEVIYNPRRCF